MQIPEHWAEARTEGKVKGKRRVVRRFGWSDTSAVEAEEMAERRAAAALSELQQGRIVNAREPKIAYGGDGLPIREQVLARDGDLVITRNSYGAHCLNEPDVMFVDVDVEAVLAPWLERALSNTASVGAIFCVLLAIWLFSHQGPVGCVLLLAAVLLPLLVVSIRQKLRDRPGVFAANKQQARERIDEVASTTQNGRFAVYETPRGWRVLALHRTFDPRSREARDLMTAFGTDPTYAQMCEVQACFRARTSGKPWRMGIATNMRPRPGLWPIRPERMPVREAWVTDYEARAAGFAACRFVAELGTGRCDPRCQRVQRVHDELAKARSQLPLA